ncbi:MAG: hypothetical protein ACI8S6_005483 [Myxococcota bacterium]|jgi:hypothetical protein
MRPPPLTATIACLLLFACGEPAPLPSSTNNQDTGSVPLDLDEDGDGFVASEDCDDGDPAVSPVAEEVCDGIDNDCDVFIDEGDATDTVPWHQDADEDGYGDGDGESEPVYACTAPTGRVASSDDCDDYDPDVHPDGDEVCDGKDNDCDGLTDSQDPQVDLTTTTTFYADDDGDSYGDPNSLTLACAQPPDCVSNSRDCDDDDDTVSPDGVEVCDGVDNDCDGDIDTEDSELDACLASSQ